MSTSPVRTYLEELTTVAEKRLGARRSAEQDDEIGEHIDAAIAAGPPDTQRLDRLGSPREIVEAEVSEAPVPQQPRLRAQDVIAIFLLLGGGFIFLIGWFIGAGLLWVSDRWTTRDKLIGTLLVPGGLASVFLVGGMVTTTTTTFETCSSGGGCTTVGGDPASPWLGITLGILLLAAPVASAIYLAVRAKAPIRP